MYAIRSYYEPLNNWPMFWKTYRQWLIKLINQRLHLCKHGYTPELRQPTEELKRLIDFTATSPTGFLPVFLPARPKSFNY